jgi:hypothetical protein
MERIDVLPKQGIPFNQHAYLGGKKHSFFENKKERKNIHFSFRRERFYERIIGEIITHMLNFLLMSLT